VTVLDAQAIVALLIGEPAASPVAALLRDPGAPAKVNAVTIAEVVDVLVRLRGRAYPDVAEKLDWLEAGGLEVVAVEGLVGRTAGRLRADHYDRRQRSVSLPDCLALATARAHDEPLATSDPALVEVARREGAQIIGLPDSAGRLPD
jgi:predicted nucleic acid-binding protein